LTGKLYETLTFTQEGTTTSKLDHPRDCRLEIVILVGGAITILKNMKVNGKDDIPYMKWKIENVPNHQAVYKCTFDSELLESFITFNT